MKLKKFICFIVGLVLFSTISMNPYASEQVDLKDLPEIEPYQQIIDDLNNELGSEISIPDDFTIENAGFTKEEIYNNILNIPLTEFKDNLKKEYDDFISNKNIDPKSNDTGTRVTIKPIIDDSISLNEGVRVTNNEGVRVTNNDNNTGIKIIPLTRNNVQSKAIREQIIQKRFLYNGDGASRGAVDLESEIFSATGAIGTYSYSKIIDYAYYTFTDRTHFRITDKNKCSYSLSNSNKTCTVQYYGAHFTGTGLMLTGVMKYTIGYNAN
ncbi:hypothetical protein [Clostridium celatum]|uniref:hypothetical protein n=1 Tax=Clostridium celatum TaxID=36834 RepID=UPI001899BFAB|nr:hypothetical protein [Clostridium celatum]